MVAIKDMEIPESCAECRMKKRCEQGVAGGWREDKRVDGCPLIEIVTCKDCCNVNCSYHAHTCDPEEYRPDFYCADAIRRG